MPHFVSKDVPLAPYTTLNVGGNAEYFAVVESVGTLREALAWAKQGNLPVTILGGGSNVLVPDAGIRGLVLRVELSGITYEEGGGESVLVRVCAGERWDDFVEGVAERGIWGLENLSGIPGTVGAAPVQNINAYGVSASDTIHAVTAVHRETGAEKTFSKDECRFRYRDSFFKSRAGSAHIITEVTFLLTGSRDVHTEYRSSSQSIARYLTEKNIAVPTPADVREAVLRARGNIGMLQGMFQSAGSFFKNTVVSRETFAHIEAVVSERHREKGEKLSPWHWDLPDGTVKVSTAFLMECTPYNKTDFAGKMFAGRVGISPLHTLSIVNVGGATATDVRAFAEVIIGAVFEEFSVRIEPEVCFL